jgi:TetR/AcrR family transcriptional regulator, tetracycline repressor protein
VILDAALDLIDADGIDAFSMRRLGAHLGVDPMAVYHHIGGKRAIVLALVERVFAGFAVPTPGAAGSSACGRGPAPTSSWR